MLETLFSHRIVTISIIVSVTFTIHSYYPIGFRCWRNGHRKLLADLMYITSIKSDNGLWAIDSLTRYKIHRNHVRCFQCKYLLHRENLTMVICGDQSRTCAVSHKVKEKLYFLASRWYSLRTIRNPIGFACVSFCKLQSCAFLCIRIVLIVQTDNCFDSP